MTFDMPATARLRDGTFRDISDSFGLLPTPVVRLFGRSVAVIDTPANVARFLEPVNVEGSK